MEWEERDRMIDPMAQRDQAYEERTRKVEHGFNALTSPDDIDTEDLDHRETFIAGCKEIGGTLHNKWGADLTPTQNTHHHVKDLARRTRNDGVDTLVCHAQNLSVGLHTHEGEPVLLRADDGRNEIEVHEPRIGATPETNTRYGEMVIANSESGAAGVSTIDSENQIDNLVDHDEPLNPDPNTEFRIKRARAELDQAMMKVE